MGTQAVNPLAEAAGDSDPNVAEANAIRGIGVCLEATEAYLGEWVGDPAIGEAVVTARYRPSIPPSALLPRLPGEPVRADVALASASEGFGRTLAARGNCHPRDGVGPLPLAYAWAMLGLDEARTSEAWPWSLSVQGPLSPADAIGAYSRQRAVWPTLTAGSGRPCSLSQTTSESGPSATLSTRRPGWGPTSNCSGVRSQPPLNGASVTEPYSTFRLRPTVSPSGRS